MIHELPGNKLSSSARLRLKDSTTNQVFSYTAKLQRHGNRRYKMGHTTALSRVYDQGLQLAADHVWLQIGLPRVPLNVIVGLEARITSYRHKDYSKSDVGTQDFGLGEAHNIMIGIDRPKITLKPLIQKALANHYVLIARSNQDQVQFVFYNIQNDRFEDQPTFGWTDYTMAVEIKNQINRQLSGNRLFVGKILWYEGTCQLGIRLNAYIGLRPTLERNNGHR